MIGKLKVLSISASGNGYLPDGRLEKHSKIMGIVTNDKKSINTRIHNDKFPR